MSDEIDCLIAQNRARSKKEGTNEGRGGIAGVKKASERERERERGKENI